MTSAIKGIKISISVYFALVLAVAFALSPDGYGGLGMISCIFHETGHLLVMKLVGCKVKGISFGPYGMRIDSAYEGIISGKQEALISFGGPCVNLLLIITGFFLKNQGLISVNIILFVFNLLPVEGTDGYSILLNLFFVKKNQAALKIVSAAFLVLVYFLGIAVFLKSGYNFTLIAVAVYLTAFKFLSQGNRLYR